MSLLTLSLKGDVHASAISWALNEVGVSAAFLALNSAGSTPNELSFRTGERPLADSIDRDATLFFRRLSIPVNVATDAPLHEDAALEAANQEETFTRFLEDFENTLPLYYRVVNDPSAVRRSNKKINHMATAEAIGLDVPSTLVSSDINQIRAFAAAHEYDIVYKPLRPNVWRLDGGHLVTTRTRRLTRDDIETISASPPMPAIYQALIQKRAEYRVCIFGDQCVAARQGGLPGMVDWRSAMRRGGEVERVDLPSALTAHLLKLAGALGADICTMDIAEDQAGRYWFLDFNTNGQFLFLEQYDTAFDMLRVATRYLSWACGASVSDTALNAISLQRYVDEAYPAFVADEGQDTDLGRPVVRKAFDPALKIEAARQAG